jgi:hypothetical protein
LSSNKSPALETIYAQLTHPSSLSSLPLSLSPSPLQNLPIRLLKMIPRIATALFALLLLLTSTTLSAPISNPDPAPSPEASLLHHRAVDISTDLTPASIAHDLIVARPDMPTDETAEISQAPDPSPAPAEHINMEAETALSREVEVKPKRRHFFRAVERDIWDGEGLLRRGFWGVREVE